MITNANSINIYYEKSGTGTPLIMLHGNNESGKIFDKARQELSSHFTVYTPDSRCHGKSQHTNELSYNALACDVIEFVRSLKIENPVLFGFSDGGITSLLCAIKEPNMFKAIIASGANTNPKGLKSTVLTSMKIKYFFTHDKKTKLMITEPNITQNDLQQIKIPSLITAGEFDIIKPSDTKKIADNIKNSTLKIIKGEFHGSYIVGSTKIASIIKEFLNNN